MSVLDPCLADTRHPVVANALHSFQCFQPISNAPVLIMISFHLHCNPGKEVGQDLTESPGGSLRSCQNVSPTSEPNPAVPWGQAGQEGWVLSLGSILALVPADHPGLGVSEITGYRVIPLLEFPRLLSLYLITSTQQPPHSPGIYLCQASVSL